MSQPARIDRDILRADWVRTAMARTPAIRQRNREPAPRKAGPDSSAIPPRRFSQLEQRSGSLRGLRARREPPSVVLGRDTPRLGIGLLPLGCDRVVCPDLQVTRRSLL